ncbi:MAG: leucyl aminopeptidase, partial [Candidatus Veblenbacteria bacterium]|nr:leucyl aminopeptidase [Candidatus Veblenbacteria bacterium]
DEVKGTFGDVANLGKSGYGGAITGAMFLKQFATGYPWAHLDIAGPMKIVEGQYLSKGASGVGTRLLIELARQRARPALAAVAKGAKKV